MKTLAVLCTILLLIGCSCNKTAKEMKKIVTNMVEIEFHETEDLLKVPCATLLKAFQDDIEKAKLDYDGKEYIITGIVKDRYIGGVSYILLSDATQPIGNNLICFFNDKFPFDIQSDDINKLNIGDSVTIKGTIDISENLVLLRNCLLLNEMFAKWDLITP